VDRSLKSTTARHQNGHPEEEPIPGPKAEESSSYPNPTDECQNHEPGEEG